MYEAGIYEDGLGKKCYNVGMVEIASGLFILWMVAKYVRYCRDFWNGKYRE